MLKVYGSLRSRATRVLMLLEELGVEYEHIALDNGGHKSDDYRKIHPLGKMPALQDGDITLIESVGICMYLTDKYADKGLAPALDSPDRGVYFQWCTYICATFEPTLMSVFAAKSQGEAAVQEAKSQMSDVLGVIKNALEGKEYLVGNRFTTADLLMGSSLGWVAMMGALELDESLQAYVGRVMSRPACQKVVGQNA